MPIYPAGLDKIQWAKEATAGTDLATTSLVHCEKATFEEMDSRDAPEVVRGLMWDNRGFETPVKRWTQWTIEGYFTYEQAQNWFGGAIATVASPTLATWTHTLDPTVFPTPHTYTFERRVTDGSTPFGQAWHYATLQKLTLTFADGQAVRYKAEGFARRVQTETLTAAQTLPTPELAPMALSRLFIDTTYAGIGGTQVASQFLGATLEINTGAVPIWTGDNRTDLDYTTISFDANARGVKASISAYLGAQYSTEKTAAEAQSLRAVRLQLSGSSSRDCKIDFLAKYEKASLFNFGEQNGQRIITLPLVSATDGTNALVATVVNAVGTYA